MQQGKNTLERVTNRLRQSDNKGYCEDADYTYENCNQPASVGLHLLLVLAHQHHNQAENECAGGNGDNNVG